MAGRDLAKELEKDSFKLDANQEKKVVEAVMLLVKDTNNMVQEQAIKWCATVCLLFPFIHSFQYWTTLQTYCRSYSVRKNGYVSVG